MYKNISITSVSSKSASTLLYIKHLVLAPMYWLRRYYSDVLDKQLDMRQTWLLLNAQAAFAMTFFPAEASLTARVACCAWLASAVMKCRKAL